LYPKDLSYVIRLVKNVIPHSKKEDPFMVTTFENGKEPVSQDIMDIDDGLWIQDAKNNHCLMVQLMKADGENLTVVEEFILDSVGYKSKLHISKDGQYISIIEKKYKCLQVYKIENNDIKTGIKNMKEGNIYREYINKQDEPNPRVHISIDSRWVAIYGRTQIAVLDLDKETDGQTEFFYSISIDKAKYSRILGVQLCSNGQDDYRLDMALKV